MFAHLLYHGPERASQRGPKATIGGLLLLLLVVLGFGGSMPVQAAPTATTVTVRNNLMQNVPGAQVYKNCLIQGVTNAAGQITLTNVQAGDHLQVRKLVYTGTTNKQAHNGWSYHVWQTNIVQNNDGTQSDFVINNPALPQTVGISPSNAQIGFNLVASVEYNATPGNLNMIRQQVARASEFLFDATDGQMFFESLTIYEDKSHWADADIRYLITVRPNVVGGGGPAAVISTDSHISMMDTSSHRLLVHEWGHYALGALDEYFAFNEATLTKFDTTCTLDQASHDESERASIMGTSTITSEFCGDDNHNHETYHHERTGRSVWAGIVALWNGNGATLRSPMSRGVVNPGPTSLPCYIQLTASFVHSPVEACQALHVTIVEPSTAPGEFGVPVPGLNDVSWNVILRHGSRYIKQAASASNTVYIYGAVPGDTIYVNRTQEIGGMPYIISGQATVSSCVPLTIETRLWLSLSPISRPSVDEETGVFEVFLDTLGTRQTLRATVDQDGQEGRGVRLTYDEQAGGYVGRYAIRRDKATNFTLVVETLDEQGVAVPAIQRYTSARVQTHPFATSDLFAPHDPVNLGVGSSGRELPEGTEVLAGTTSMPAPAPDGLLVVGGPYTTQGGAPFTGPAAWTFQYDEARAAGTDPRSLSVYRFEQGTWAEMPCTVNSEHGEVYTQSDRWGIYAVFARPTR